MRARFIDFPKYSCIIGRIWLTLAKSLESVVFIEKAANFSLKLLIFKDFCKYNLLIIKCLTIEFYFLSSTKVHKTIFDGELSPSDEVEEGRFWPLQEISDQLGKGVFTPNFESEFERMKFGQG